MKPKIKRKRQNKGPYRKWTKGEEEKLLNFLRANQLFEKPTAQMFYMRFMHESGIESEWRLVRAKVRNLRTSFQKAKLCLNSVDAEDFNEGETIKEVLLKKCPFFYELEEIFGYEEPTVKNAINDGDMTDNYEEVNFQDDIKPDFSEPSAEVITERSSANQSSGISREAKSRKEIYKEPTVNDDTTDEDIADNYDEVNSPNDIKPDFCEVNVPTLDSSAEIIPERSGTHQSSRFSREAKSPKGNYWRTALSSMTQVQTELLAVKKDKIAAELKLREQEFLLEKEKFLFDKETRNEEIRLKEKEIQVRILEIEMKERLAVKELQLRKEIEMEKLKRTN